MERPACFVTPSGVGILPQKLAYFKGRASANGLLFFLFFYTTKPKHKDFNKTEAEGFALSSFSLRSFLDKFSSAQFSFGTCVLSHPVWKFLLMG